MAAVAQVLEHVVEDAAAAAAELASRKEAAGRELLTSGA